MNGPGKGGAGAPDTGTPRVLDSLDAFRAWWAERRAACRLRVTEVGLTALDQWHLDPASGNLRHASGRFFTVEGLQVQAAGCPLTSQPVINQPEIGMLGILVREIDGVPHCLMQAKTEPGNVNTLQLSPTVQATRSNYTQVHRGRGTPYLEYFTGRTRGEVLADVLQSEQGAWFWRKRNRNMVVKVPGDVPDDVPGAANFRWLPLPLLHRLLAVDNLVNMDARTVLACMLFLRPRADAARSDAAGPDALDRSFAATSRGALHTMREVLSWFTEAKTWCDWSARLVPLSAVDRWTVGGDRITDDEGRDFSILGFRVEAAGREVARWSQPLLRPHGRGLAILLVRPVNGVLHVLLEARAEYGLLDLVEMGPSCQLRPGADRSAVGEPFLREPDFGLRIRQAAGAVRYDATLSEEGGRFHHALTRYRIVEVGADFPVEVPKSYCWLTVSQVMRLLRHGHYLNVEARTLLACLSGSARPPAPPPS